jgi:predicted S18 family serine protease
MKEFDKLIEEMDKHMFQAGEDIKNIDLGLIQRQAELALDQVDVEKIMKDVTLSLKEINIEKIMAEVTESLKGINWEGHEVETKQALHEAKEEVEKARQELKSVDMSAIKKELENARQEIKNISTEEIRKELQNARQEIERSKDELSKIDMKKIMAEAKESVEEAKMELKQIKAMFNEMEREGIIHAKDGFTIEFKDKDLYINGVKQKESVTDKYRKYINDEHFQITIEKE